MADDERSDEARAQIAATMQSAEELVNELEGEIWQALEPAQADITRALTHLRELGFTADEAIAFFTCSVDLRWNHNVKPVPRATDPMHTLRRQPGQSNSAWERQKQRMSSYWEDFDAAPIETQKAIRRYVACLLRLRSRAFCSRLKAKYRESNVETPEYLESDVETPEDTAIPCAPWERFS